MEIAKKCLVVGCAGPAVANGLCDKHRKRVERHGSVEPTRPLDWGARHKHALYRVWTHLMRWHKKRCCAEWLDFWKFVADIGDQPQGKAIFSRRDPDEPFSKTNWYWRVSAVSAEDRKKLSEAMREWRRAQLAANPDYFKDKDLRKLYGITLAEYRAILERQGGGCAICGLQESMEINGKVVQLAVDHCHDGGHVRGILCAKCNQGIGCFRNDVGLLAKAIEYLKE